MCFLPPDRTFLICEDETTRTETGKKYWKDKNVQVSTEQSTYSAQELPRSLFVPLTLELQEKKSIKILKVETKRKQRDKVNSVLTISTIKTKPAESLVRYKKPL